MNRRDWIVLLVLAAAGGALRLSCAQGGLWLDEAWSAQMAQEAGTPAGVFLWINHDNSHHLNTLWLQLVGFGAPPPLARALAIVSSTIAIVVAGQIGALRGRATAYLTAFTFAVSPAMVTLGSEARGYAPMTLALLVSILLVHRALLTDDMRARRSTIAIAFGLGMLSQMTMAYGICALAGWVFTERWRRTGMKKAVADTVRLLGPGLLTAVTIVAAVFGVARFAGTGFRFGDYVPFGILLYLHGLIELIGYTIGFPVVSVWLIAIVLLLLILAPRLEVSRIAFYRLAIAGFPLTLAALEAPNPGHPRYYLLVGTALLLMLAEMAAAAFGRGGWYRWTAFAATAAFTIGSVAQDIDLLRNQRGDPNGAIDALAARAPRGVRLMYDRALAVATLRYAAAYRHYPLQLVPVHCPADRYLLLDRWRGETFPGRVTLCGGTFRPIAQHIAHGMSGTHWTLYERRP